MSSTSIASEMFLRATHRNGTSNTGPKIIQALGLLNVLICSSPRKYITTVHTSHRMEAQKGRMSVALRFRACTCTRLDCTWSMSAVRSARTSSYSVLGALRNHLNGRARRVKADMSGEDDRSDDEGIGQEVLDHKRRDARRGSRAALFLSAGRGVEPWHEILSLPFLSHLNLVTIITSTRHSHTPSQ